MRGTRRAHVGGIFPNEGAIVTLIGTMLLEANDEWQLQHRYMQTKAMAGLTSPTTDTLPTAPSQHQHASQRHSAIIIPMG